MTPESLQEVNHKLNHLKCERLSHVSLALSAIVFNHRKCTLDFSYTLHSLKYPLGWGEQGITSGLATTEVRQSQLLLCMKLRTVPKATGIGKLTLRHLASLTVLVKAVPIQSILYP